MIFEKGLLVLLVAFFVSHCNGKATESVNKLCKQKDCRAGRECVIKFGIATCECRKYCPDHAHRVCGSDDRTYHNPCQLHQTACKEKRHIRVNYVGPCIALHLPSRTTIKPKQKVETKVETKVNRPLVCDVKKRDLMRKMMMDWLLTKINGKKYEDVLKHYFKEMDYDLDKQLTSDELIGYLEKYSIVKFTDVTDQLEEHLLKGLCVDAVIELGDTDNDWQLHKKEFIRMMEPEFVPKVKQCQLRYRSYNDGDATRKGCNVCVCSSGRWVCTGHDCKIADEKVKDHSSDDLSSYQMNLAEMIKKMDLKGKTKP